MYVCRDKYYLYCLDEGTDWDRETDGLSKGAKPGIPRD